MKADHLIGLHAYDTGCTDSGIHDEVLKGEIFEKLSMMESNEYRIWAANFIKKHYLSKKNLELGFGMEDAIEFYNWLEDNIPR